LWHSSDVAANSKLVDLRNLLAERFPHPQLATTARFRTGQALIDSVTGLGLPKGAITEISSPQLSAGSASLIAGLVRAAGASRYFIALIDGRDSFDPEPIEQASLHHLLWVRCRHAAEAVKAADLLLRDGNFPIVLLDLVLNRPNELRKIPQPNWYRLQRLVEPTSTACLVLSRQSMVASAQLKIGLEHQWTLQTLERGDSISAARLHLQRSHLTGLGHLEEAEAI
jgi:hypothetical protein